jgi:acyl carrier protein
VIDQKVKEIVIHVLKLSEDKYSVELAAGDIPEWDSLAHLALLQAIEKEFSIALDVSDAIDIESVYDIIAIVKEYKKG